MDRKEISGIARELDEALEKASGAGRTEGKRTKAWKEPLESEGRMPDEAETGQLEESLYEIGDELEEEPEPGDRGSRLSRIFLPSDGLIAAFFIPVLIMVIIFAQRGIFPFGEETFLRTDMYHQYAPFFSEFRHKLTGGGSLLYSWDVGMGVNFSALYAYYLASPLNWLVLLCPSSLIIEFMTCMIVVKTGLAGLSFAYYLREHNHFNGFGVGFFGIFYAMSGYMAAYSWNIMWLDCILLFPLIMLGLERLVHEKKGILYCVSRCVHFVQLLYFYHDLSVHGGVLFLSSDFGGEEKLEGLRGQRPAVWRIFASGRCAGSGSSAAGGGSFAEYGIRGISFSKNPGNVFSYSGHAGPPYRECAD